MPYFLRKREDETCVVKGTKDDPKEIVKCHPTHADALAHLRALYVHVEDVQQKDRGEGQGVGGPKQGDGGVDMCVCPECGATATHERGTPCMEIKCPKCGAAMQPKSSSSEPESVEEVTKELTDALRNIPSAEFALQALLKQITADGSALSTYKTADGKDGWLAVSTAAAWDLQQELFTTKAMDWDIARAERTKEYPELRLFHIRGFKLGKCTSMARIGNWAVDKGIWNDTAFAQSMKDNVARNTGRWKVSRGFYTVEAAGHCPECGSGLTVRLVNYMLGAVCPTCKTYYAKPNMLAGLQVLKSMTFDISVTDKPAVRQTAITAYTVNE